MPAAPAAAEVATYTKRVQTTVVLAGIAPAGFTLAVQLSVRKVFAANAGVHYFYVTIRVTGGAGRRQLAGGDSVAFTVAVSASPTQAARVAASVAAMREPGADGALAAQLNAQMQADGNAVAGAPLAVASVAAATQSDAEPPAHVVAEGSGGGTQVAVAVAAAGGAAVALAAIAFVRRRGGCARGATGSLVRVSVAGNKQAGTAAAGPAPAWVGPSAQQAVVAQAAAPSSEV